MTKALRRPAALAALAGTALLLSGCGVNTIPAKEEAVKAKWADVENQYQRRADLIPNLVSTVKGYAVKIFRRHGRSLNLPSRRMR